MPLAISSRRGGTFMNATELTNGAPAGENSRDAELAQIRDALRGLQYGSVNIIVQDGVIVQIDRLEKRRIRRPGASDQQPG
jgi:hypothetical protein